MPVSGMTKSMQTHTYFAFWKQKLSNVNSLILRHIILILLFDFYLFAAYTFYRNLGNRPRDDRLPVLLTTYFS